MLLAVGGCARAEKGFVCTATGNALDDAVCADLAGKSYRPSLASDAEICARLFLDALGRRATNEEIAGCAGRDIDALLRSMQSTEGYRRTQKKRWADRLGYSDLFTDPILIKSLDGLVDDLYQGRLLYPDFVARVLSHPAFISRFIAYGLRETVTEGAFRAFLGRPATTPEIQDIDVLWSPWRRKYKEVEGVALTGTTARYAPPVIDPFACEAGVHACVSTIFGVTSLDFPRNGRTTLIALSDLSAEDWRALETPGRLLASTTMLDEAAADEVLQRFLGWDLGSRLPEARRILAERLRRTGDLVDLERVVLTSIAYRQSARADAEHPRPRALVDDPLAYGPTKMLDAESWLDSAGMFIGLDLGGCDDRYPNLPEDGYANVAPLDDTYPRKSDGSFDTWYRDTASAMGGCPGFLGRGESAPRARRTLAAIDTAAATDRAMIELCFVRDASSLLPAGVDARDRSAAALRSTAIQVWTRAWARMPEEPEVAALLEAASSGCDDCDAESLARGLCSAVLGGASYAVE
jgi:hypothetical protein